MMIKSNRYVVSIDVIQSKVEEIKSAYKIKDDILFPILCWLDANKRESGYSSFTVSEKYGFSVFMNEFIVKSKVAQSKKSKLLYELISLLGFDNGKSSIELEGGCHNLNIAVKKASLLSLLKKIVFKVLFISLMIMCFFTEYYI